MSYMKLYKVILINLVAVFFCSLMFVNIVGAAPSFANAAQGIEISPTLVELNAMRGNTYNINLSIRNVTAADLVYSSSVADFSSADETGSPKIFIDETLPDTASIRPWTSVIEKFSLKTRQSKTVVAQIQIPNNAEPGGHYGVIRFTSSAPEMSDSGVGLAGSAGVLILIKVDGEIVEAATLSEFFTANSGDQTGFFENAPITFVTRIKNEGNIHLKPSGSVQIHDMFGGLVASVAVNADKSNVLPNSIRRFESKYSDGFMIGRFKADLTMGYGTTGQTITNTIYFWVIPYKLIITGIFVLITVIFILVRLIKVYNKHIIKKAENEKTKKSE